MYNLISMLDSLLYNTNAQLPVRIVTVIVVLIWKREDYARAYWCIVDCNLNFYFLFAGCWFIWMKTITFSPLELDLTSDLRTYYLHYLFPLLVTGPKWVGRTRRSGSFSKLRASIRRSSAKLMQKLVTRDDPSSHLAITIPAVEGVASR